MKLLSVRWNFNRSDETLIGQMKLLLVRWNFNRSDGLPDCAPGKCPRTAEISPIKCSSDLAMFFNNGYPTVRIIIFKKKIWMAWPNVYFCRTVRKARSATQRPPMLPREIHAGYNLHKVRNLLKKKKQFKSLQTCWRRRRGGLWEEMMLLWKIRLCQK